MKTPQVSAIAQELLSVFEMADLKRKKVSEEETIKVSEAMSSVAFLYEKIRNVIDYREEHLFRIGAIERSLQRRPLWKNKEEEVAESLIRELIRSGYLENRRVPVIKINQVSQIISKYRHLFRALPSENQKNEKLIDWVLSLAASEIETVLVPQEEEKALMVAFYQLLNKNLKYNGYPEKTTRTRFYIASQRALLKPSLPTLRYNLLLGYLPEWPEAKPDKINYFATNLIQIKEKIETHLNHPQTEKLVHYCRRHTAPFLILKDVIGQFPLETRGEFQDPEKLEERVIEVCQRRYSQAKSRLTRGATRSIIYIFLTKMLFALFLEFPFDLLVVHRVKLFPLAINSIFPPALMFAFVLSVPKPGEKNTQRIIEKIKEIVYQGTYKTTPLTLSRPEAGKKSLRTNAFRGIYALTFLLSFGLIIWGLDKLEFNFFSVLIFLFFLTVVSFFAYRVSQAAKELILEEKESLFSAISDFFVVPILRTGRRLSSELAKVNVFNFILDFFIEAPLKSILEIGEEWLAFLREKKEEVV